jgi:formyltetrahydrofolate-dependent phosphoribosylglycinamide formyltransferase
VKLAVFVSGRGSNLKALLDAQNKHNNFEVVVVLSDKSNCSAFEIAKDSHVKTFTLGSGEGYIGYKDLNKLLVDLGIELIVLAGFLKLIPEKVINEFHNKIINIHPALLPSFGGKGMYGLNVHKAVYKSSAKVSGATVHFVDLTYDTGKIIAQKCVDITDVKSPEEIAERVLEVEHQLLPYVVNKIAEDKIKIIDNRVIILN